MANASSGTSLYIGFISGSLATIFLAAASGLMKNSLDHTIPSDPIAIPASAPILCSSQEPSLNIPRLQRLNSTLP